MPLGPMSTVRPGDKITVIAYTVHDTDKVYHGFVCAVYEGVFEWQTDPRTPPVATELATEENEGIRWVRGHVDLNGAEVAALRAAKAF